MTRSRIQNDRTSDYTPTVCIFFSKLDKSENHPVIALSKHSVVSKLHVMLGMTFSVRIRQPLQRIRHVSQIKLHTRKTGPAGRDSPQV